MQRGQCPIYNETLIWSMNWRYCRFLVLYVLLLIFFSALEMPNVTFVYKPQLKKSVFQSINNKHRYLIYTWSDIVFKGTVVNRTLSSLHGDCRVTLNYSYSPFKCPEAKTFYFQFVTFPFESVFLGAGNFWMTETDIN